MARMIAPWCMSASTGLRPLSRGEILAPWLAGLCLAAPNLAFHYPPMIDLPFHEGIVAVMRGLSDSTKYPTGLYVLNLGHGNQLFYVCAWALSFLLGVPLACKAVVAATVLAIPLAGARLARHVGASPWAALLLAPVAIGWTYYWGLIANLIGLAVLFAMLPTLDRLAERPTCGRALAAASGTLLTYEGHELTMIIYAGAALIFAAGHTLDLRKTSLRISPFLVGIAVSGIEHVWATSLLPPGFSGTPVAWSAPLQKLMFLPNYLVGDHERPVLRGLFGICVLDLGLLVIGRMRAGGAPVTRNARELVHRYRFEILGASCFALYLALPSNVHSATLVYERFLAPAYALAAICAARRLSELGRMERLLVSVVPIATTMVLFPTIADVSRTADDLDRLFAHIAPGSAVASLDLGPSTRELHNSTNTSLGARALTERGGRLLFSCVTSPVAPILYAPAHDWPEPTTRMFTDHYRFAPRHDFTRFRYLLLRTTSWKLALAIAIVLAPEASLVDTAGDWMLFESRLPVVPLLSPDVPLPTPRPESLRDRIEMLKKTPKFDPSEVRAQPSARDAEQEPFRAQ
jgi:hypothetical protein